MTQADRWRRAHEGFSLLYGMAGAIMVSAIALWLLQRYGLAIQPQHMDRVFAGKLTFLSFVLAALAVQHHYFYKCGSPKGKGSKQETPHGSVRRDDSYLRRRRAVRTDPAVRFGRC